jgi:hypothetical protein
VRLFVYVPGHTSPEVLTRSSCVGLLRFWSALKERCVHLNDQKSEKSRNALAVSLTIANMCSKRRLLMEPGSRTTWRLPSIGRRHGPSARSCAK